MICALAVDLSFGLRSYANAAFNPDAQITGTSSPAYWCMQGLSPLHQLLLLFWNSTRQLQVLLPTLPAPAFSPVSISYVTSNNLYSFGNLEVDFVGF